LDRAGLHQSSERHVQGTVAYMAPEQAAEQPLTPAADWYAVGVMFYVALTGQLPLAGSLLDVLVKKQETDPVPASLIAGVPDDLTQLTMELLSRTPAARPPGREVLRRLAGTAAAPAPAAPPSRRQPLIGRDSHLQVLTEAFADVRAGRTV